MSILHKNIHHILFLTLILFASHTTHSIDGVRAVLNGAHASVSIKQPKLPTIKQALEDWGERGVTCPGRLQAVIDGGADVNEIVNGRPALHRFIHGPDFAEVLLKNGADPDTRIYSDEIHFCAIDKCPNSEVRACMKNTPLEEAINHGYLNSVKLLLKYKADITRLNEEFQNPLEYARANYAKAIKDHEIHEKINADYKKQQYHHLIFTLKSLGKTDTEIKQLNLSESSETQRDKEAALKWQKEKKDLEEIITILEIAYNEKMSTLSDEEKNQIEQKNEDFKARFIAAQQKADKLNKANPHLYWPMQK